MITLQIVQDIGGEPMTVGELVFDEARKGKLNVLLEGPEGEALARNWAETAARDTLMLDTSQKTELDGEEVTEYLSQIVEPGDEDYPWAVLDHLQKTYHYEVSVVEPTE